MDTAEAAERENYQGGLVTAYVKLGISIVLLVLWLICFMVVKVKFDNAADKKKGEGNEKG